MLFIKSSPFQSEWVTRWYNYHRLQQAQSLPEKKGDNVFPFTLMGKHLGHVTLPVLRIWFRDCSYFNELIRFLLRSTCPPFFPLCNDGCEWYITMKKYKNIGFILILAMDYCYLREKQLHIERSLTIDRTNFWQQQNIRQAKVNVIIVILVSIEPNFFVKPWELTDFLTLCRLKNQKIA